MRRVKIESGECVKYGSEAPVEPGSYLICDLPRGMDQTEKDKFKRGLGLIAAKGGQAGRFAWLAPDEPWVHRLVSGGLILHPWNEGEPDWDMLKVDPNQLRPWQLRGVKQAWWRLAHLGQYRRGHVVSLGGGKTLFGLVLSRMVDRWAVCAPRYAHHTWLTEPVKWGFEPPIVSTYESAHKLFYGSDGPQLLILDEVGSLKNPDTQRHERIDRLSRSCEMVIGLTGHPNAGGGPPDWRWLRCIEPGCVPRSRTSWQYLWGLDTELVEVKPGQKAYVTNRWDTDKIATFVNPYVQTVDTSELLAHLPPVEFRTIRLPKPRDFDIIRSGAGSTGGKSKRHAQLLQCTDGFVYDDLGRAIDLNSDKVDVIREFVDSTGEPVLIYAAHTAAVSKLARAFADYGPSVIEGATGDVTGQIDRFVTGKTTVLIANARYAAAMNLQEKCRIVIFMSPSSKPDDRKQGVGRVYRPGQSRGVIVVDVVCENTLDERRLELVSGHEEMSEAQVEALLEIEASR